MKIPKNGDVVICTSGSWIGNIGYLSDVTKKSAQLRFNSRPFFDGESIMLSGGESIITDMKKLTKTKAKVNTVVSLCEKGFNGFPNGEEETISSTVWEYESTGDNPFGVFTVDQILLRKRMDYEHEAPSKPSPLNKGGVFGDIAGREIFNSAKNFERLLLKEIKGDFKTPTSFVLSNGLNQIAVFKNSLSMMQFFNAYNLDEASHIDGIFYAVTPNMDVEKWNCVGKRKIVINPHNPIDLIYNK
ncbi:hypothetical protein [Psychromonas sp. SP041]|uniref:hypothetical protein n=1 Tax=Psychromonas sp. SP041 TaxID=1365007 RepID=UPI0003F961A7|nr:hypothetical protein [Psychromonas sp. SP041]